VSIKPPTEAEIQAACIDALAGWGAVVVRTNSGAVRVGKRLVRFNRTPGCSDTLVCLPQGGRFAAIEFKRPGKGLTLLQAAFLRSVVKAGGLGLVADGLGMLRERLKEEGYDVGRLL
jgi:hypothetical protein